MNCKNIDILFQENENIVISLAPTYKIAFENNYFKIINAIGKLDISVVSETINGYYLIIDKVKKDLINKPFVISEACPIIRNLIINKYVKYVPYLDGYSSPLANHCSYLKENNSDAFIIFIGPCKNKIAEAKKDNSANVCLSFFEFMDYLEYKKLLDDNTNNELEFYNELHNNLDEVNIINIDGLKNVINFLETDPLDIDKKGYINLFYCQNGCVGKTYKKYANK